MNTPTPPTELDPVEVTPAGVGRREFVKAAGVGLATLGLLSAGGVLAAEPPAPGQPADADNFFRSDRVQRQAVTFKTQYLLQVTGILVSPLDAAPAAGAPAIVIGHPMGAVKEQSALLYAQKLAERGFVTLAIDLPFWGESQGQPRNLVAPELYTEAFSAAVDFLGTRPGIDRERLGVLGICGSGCFALNAAKIDPRLKAIATVSLYDMGAVTRNGLRHSQNLEQRKALVAKAAQQRYREYSSGEGSFLDYLPQRPDATTDAVTREFWEFYRTPRGQAVPVGMTLERTQNRMLTSEIRFMNFYPLSDLEMIAPRPLLFVAGDQAHSREFSEDAYRLASGAKELLWVPGAGHVDLYDRVGLIPWDRLHAFFHRHLA
ncbi:alpha/beta hydrolase [Pseudomonas sp. AS2.8]|uniref:alpha/beta hydrolase n=1 Tax=Pseudomonas sp. AS2.8 TaxID=2587128 RepID=UPI0016191F04|nr:alpha/beta hydrolase [Pseudomonas sp. AS2.8]MBB2896239.1 hypothetical protein [Pseudomonas sp. AS2.8]